MFGIKIVQKQRYHLGTKAANGKYNGIQCECFVFIHSFISPEIINFECVFSNNYIIY